MTHPSPWSRNEGRYGVPTSGVPVSRFVAKAARAPTPYVAQRLADAEQRGVPPSCTRTILLRIEAAMDLVVEKGFGAATSIYLNEADLLAFRDAKGGDNWREVPIRHGATSKVYGRTGSCAVRKRVAK